MAGVSTSVNALGVAKIIRPFEGVVNNLRT